MIIRLAPSNAQSVDAENGKINQISFDNSSLCTYKLESSIKGSQYNILTKRNFIIFGQALVTFSMENPFRVTLQIWKLTESISLDLTTFSDPIHKQIDISIKTGEFSSFCER